MKKYIEELKKELNAKNIQSWYSELCIEYAERLLNNNLPVIFDREHLSLLLGVEYNYVNKVMLFNDRFYRVYKVKKKNGGYREISIPNVRLRYIQRWILDNILYRISVSEDVTGFVPEKSIVDNATKHTNKELVMAFDIKDFFPSVNIERIFNIFYYYGYTKEISYCLARICTLNDELPQGAPTSPYLANIVCRKMDIRIKCLCDKIDADFTRYADDITISGKKNIIEYLDIIKSIVIDEGFSINNDKTRAMYRNRQQRITGLIVNNNKVSVPKDKIRYLRQQIYYIKKFGVTRHLQKIQSKSNDYCYANIKEHLYGLAYFIKMVDKEKGDKFISDMDKIDWKS